MAEVNFIDTDAQTIYETIMSSLADECDEELYPGDERTIFAEAFTAVVVSIYNHLNDRARQRLLKHSRGSVLDAIGERVHVNRAAATSATTKIRFSVSAVQMSNIIIPLGTRVTADGNIYFATTEAAVLQAGDDFVDVDAACTVGGSAYNGYTEGQISTLVDLIPFVGAVNITVSSGGDDGEPYTEDGDNRYRERIRLAPASFSTAGAESSYRYYAMSADANIVDAEPIVPSACVVDIYVLLKGGALPDDAVLEKVLAVCSATEARPMTDKVNALAPTEVEYNIEFKYYCSSENENAVIQAVEGSGGAIEQYIALQCEALGQNINPDELRKKLYAAGASRVEIVSPVFTGLSRKEVAKFSGTLSVSHETE